MKHLLLFVIVAVGLALIAPTPALANHCSGSGEIDNVGGEASGECHGSTPGSPGSADSSVLWGIYCSGFGEYVDVPDQAEVRFIEMYTLPESEVLGLGFDPTGVYRRHELSCYSASVGSWLPNGTWVLEVTPPIDAAVLRDRARARINPAPPTVTTAPPLLDTFAKAPIWLWVEDLSEWDPISETECQGYTCVTVEAVAVGAIWDMGEPTGELLYCGVGTPRLHDSKFTDESPTCGYSYFDSSSIAEGDRFHGSLTVDWQFSWWINITPQGTFGTVGISTPFEVDVNEIQAVEVNP